MSLILNSSGHWQHPDGFELRAGDRVEVFLDGCWIMGEVNYRPKGRFVIHLASGDVLDIDENFTVRLVNHGWMKRPVEA